MNTFNRSILCLVIVLMMLETALAEPPKSGPEGQTVSLVFGGDVMFGRYMFRKLHRHCDDDPFVAMKPLIQSADFALMNYEHPICREIPRDILKGKSKWTIRLGSDPKDASLVAEAGFDLAVLANNHSYDCGKDGVVGPWRKWSVRG